MEIKEAQTKMVAAITADPELVILRAIVFNPGTAEIVNVVRRAPGTAQGVAAAAVKYALRGATNAETEANIIQFMEDFALKAGPL